METHTTTSRKQNPRIKANPISATLLLYMLPVFWKNSKRGLKEEDLYDILDEHKSSTLGDKLEEVWQKEHKKHPKYALHLALLKIYAPELAIISIFRYMTELILIFVMPFSIGKLVSYFEKGPPDVTQRDAYLYTGAIVLCLVIDAIITHPTMLRFNHMSMKMRLACCSLLYRKSLKLSRAALGETTIGQVVNLLSNDVRKFDEGFILFHYIWLAPVQTIVGTYLLYQLIGKSAFAGIAFLMMFIPLQVGLGKYNSTIRMRTAIRTDERVRLMNEILSGIQVIKMYTWEKPFAKLVSFARRYEIKAIRIHHYIESVLFALGMFVSRTSIFISIIVYVSLGNHIEASTAYSITAIYALLRPLLIYILSYSIIAVAEVHITTLRLQQFLSYEELPTTSNDCFESKKLKEITLNDRIPEKEETCLLPKIVFQNVCVKWFPNAPDYSLNNVNLSIEGTQLVAVIGPVGSGKSTILNTILKETQIINGSMEINGRISYASQEPWLFSASVRQNILFGDEYDATRYKSVMKLCALESDIKLLPYGDRTIISEKGHSLSGGQKARVNLARCIYKQADIYLLDDPLSAVDTRVGKQLYNNCIKKFLSNKICILITHQLQYLKNVDKILILKAGEVVADGKYDELQHSGLDFAKLLQEYQSDEQENVDMKTVRSKLSLEMEYDDDLVYAPTKEMLATGTISCNTYTQYFKAGGNVFVLVVVLLAIVAAHASGRSADYFVSYWVNLEQAKAEQPDLVNSTIGRDAIVYTYSGIIGSCIIFSLACPLIVYVFLMNASINIHENIFKKISYATMRFFNDNPVGRILNRFSKDMGIIDEYIPFILLDVTDIFMVFVGTMTLSAIINPWLLLPSALLVSLFYLLRVFYLHTSTAVKRIEAITRTPIFNHLTATMDGITTIRAFKAEKILANEFDTHQDLHSSAWYLFISSTRAFGFFLDVICITFIACITSSLVALNTGYYGGDVGLIVTQLISLSGLLQWGMRQWTELENHMTSVERVLEYTKPETEPVREPIGNLPKDWPEFGKITFQDLSMRYSPQDMAILKNLNFTINPGEKVGIVGRTGAGKSSTISALFQLYDIDGTIIIDGVDTTKLPLDILRSKLSIIPQEPVLFSGTLRKNLDPFEEYSDEILWNALEQVELKQGIEDAPGGLSSPVAECGSNFSIGQRQLICLARAIIRKNKILVLDEATANVDPRTDFLIQSTIRKSFTDCTVLTIAHRLHTIMDSDKVLVMDQGEIVEFDHAHNLLQRTNSIFYNMVQTSGNVTTAKLKSIAEESFMKLKS